MLVLAELDMECDRERERAIIRDRYETGGTGTVDTQRDSLPGRGDTPATDHGRIQTHGGESGSAAAVSGTKYITTRA